MKLFLAAPASGLPSELTAFGEQASRLHFFTNAVLAAPASGLPSLLTALASQLSVAGACASAAPIANTEIKAASAIRFIILSSEAVAMDDAKGRACRTGINATSP